MAVYDKLFVAFNDALDAIRTELRLANREQSAKSEVTVEQLTKLQSALTWQACCACCCSSYVAR